VTRLHVATLVLAGRADEAVVVGEKLARSPSAYVRGIPAMLRWHAGDPSGFGPHHAPLEPGLEINERDRLFRAAYGTAVAASFGDVAAIESVRAVIDRVLASEPDARDSAIAAVAAGYRHVLDHDEAAAVRLVAAHVARYPPPDRLGEVHLRRSPALAYVCHLETRGRWDQAPLGPSHRRAISVARQLLDGRAGRLTAGSRLAPPADVFTSLPLPWSVELAAHAEAAGSRDGQQLVAALADWAPVAVHAELSWLAEHDDDPRARRGAAALLRSVPDPSVTTLRIEVLGPLCLREGDATIDGPERRRSRVRTLLSLLALRGPVRRERVIDLMWPDLEPSAASRNLRVTLSRLRQLLEPGRRAGQPSARLRVDAASIGLAGPPRVNVDVWDLRRHLDESEQARHAGDSELVAWHLEQVTRLWRGDPLADLQEMAELTGEVEQVRRSLVDATLRLGELRLVAGRFDESLICAERARAASPYLERAHRLVIAAHLQRRDQEGVASAVAELELMLAELGLEAEPATQMLVRQARARVDAPGAAPPFSAADVALRATIATEKPR
jgi:DNA-binding SARP family transcriptional activator